MPVSAARRRRFAQLAAYDAGLPDQPLAGIDEAGRGPLAGPVVVAAAMLPPGLEPFALDDSKRLPPSLRETAAARIREVALAWTTVIVPRAEIDRVNILQATLTGMRQAWERLSVRPALTLVDGNLLPDGITRARAVVAGDGASLAIAAASVLAKTTRDALMLELEARYPGYGFARHKGYGTPEHLEALRRLGPCPEHRRSFRVVAVRGYEQECAHWRERLRECRTPVELRSAGARIQQALDAMDRELLGSAAVAELNRCYRERERELEPAGAV